MQDIGQLVGEFTWCWGWSFFIETSQGNFVWKDPEYGGDNTIRPYSGSYDDFCKEKNVPYGRNKGKHVIEAYCPGFRLIPA